ncbi:hypothetical protein K469DRAFT_760440 [Zopfia rhizophila CBS 207.26]|uniref:NAD dependent epimerase/dehydratase n=1 Tax=Zopfia rhizophila CBS 207.26 TaxID=1314779 RepID=A0A6A6DA30_9PEZI|nr:hypothetical protein K469DRAFT_760440 [Zopfia rhizophila CBS 207.26]
MVFQSYTPKPITDIFTADTDIDHRKCRRAVPVRAFALGLGRTGTASLKELGFTDIYHMVSASDILAAKYENEGDHCQVVCDWPAVAFAKELIEAYPEAKVILATRDVDSWHASMIKTFVAQWDWGSRLISAHVSKVRGLFHDYYAEVRSIVPAENRLEYCVGQGVGPLCEFLEVPVLEGTSFPHTNDTDCFVDRCRARNRAQTYNILPRGFVMGGGILAALFSASLTFHRVGTRLSGLRT